MHNYKMFFLLEELKKQSKCLDKQVACIITDSQDNILSVGYNKVFNCGGCTIDGDKQECEVTHAELIAVENLRSKHLHELQNIKAYLSLYPCPNCQRKLDQVADEIIVFGDKHKECIIDEKKITLVPNLLRELPKINGEEKQLMVIVGEYAEAITKISDFFFRSHEREDESLLKLLDEVFDVRLMTGVFLEIIQTRYDKGVHGKLLQLEEAKLNKCASAIKSGRIKPGSPYSKPLA